MNPSVSWTDHTEDVRQALYDAIEKFERGEIRAFACRLQQKDGSFQDLAFGVTEAERQQAMADMLKAYDGVLEH